MKSKTKLQKIILFVRSIKTAKSYIGYLEGAGFHVLPARLNNVATALKTVEEAKSDIVILDIGYLCAVGKEVVREFRDNYATPVIVITANGKNIDRILGLEIGADDCISEPLDPREIVARVRAILRRASKDKNEKQNEKQRFIAAGGLILDMVQRKIFQGDDEIKISGTEYEILRVMMNHPNVVMRPEKVIRRMPYNKHISNSSSMRFHISNLRAKLGDDARNPILIKSLWGAGYVFCGLPE